MQATGATPEARKRCKPYITEKRASIITNSLILYNEFEQYKNKYIIFGQVYYITIRSDKKAP